MPQGPAARGPVAGEAAADAADEVRVDAQPVQARAQPIGWARLLERVFDIDLRRCPAAVTPGASESEPARHALPCPWHLLTLPGLVRALDIPIRRSPGSSMAVFMRVSRTVDMAGMVDRGRRSIKVPAAPVIA